MKHLSLMERKVKIKHLGINNMDQEIDAEVVNDFLKVCFLPFF